MTARGRGRSVLAGAGWPTYAVVVVAVAVAGLLGVRYAGEAYPRWMDGVALGLGRQWLPLPRGWALAVIGVYDPLPLALMIAALAGLCLALGRRRHAVLAVAGPVLTGLATTILKPVVDRTKNGDLSYPSGHMGAAVAVAVVAALLLVSLVDPPRPLRGVLLVTLPALWGGAIGLAMTVTNYHYLTDAVGGACVAVAVVLSVAMLLDRWAPPGPARVVPERVGSTP